MNDKVICTERRCYWKGTTKDMLQGVSPFDPEESIVGCPNCKAINTLVSACYVDGCWKEVSCGYPTPDGYRNSCGDHYREYKAKEAEKCDDCHTCLKDTLVNGIPATLTRMIVCSDCGNKRCPKATNHRHTCTHSNEPNQEGSIY
jgi:hypothetical protein